MLRAPRPKDLADLPTRSSPNSPVCYELRNSIHRLSFQDIFPWARDIREVTTSRTNSFGFPPPQFILPSLETLFANLRAERHLKNLTPDNFALRAAHYLAEINAIHPFREANLTLDENNHASRLSDATGDTSALTTLIRSRLL